MREEDLVMLVKEIQTMKSEKQTLEIKAAKGGFPEKIYDTLSSFSNQDEGGIIIFGIKEKPDFSICGVYNVDDIQKKILEASLQMEPPVRAVLTVAEIDSKYVVSAEIPGVDVSNRPVFYLGAGLAKGSYVRVGDSDQHMTPYEIYSYDAFKKQIRNDLRAIDDESMVLWNEKRLNQYIDDVKADRKNLSEINDIEKIMTLMGIIRQKKITLAGLLCFTMYPQAYFPQLCIIAVSIPGLKMGDVDGSEARFLDNKKITGSIAEMLEDTLSFVRRNSKVKTIINENGKRVDRTEYPERAIREAIINALLHRDYSVYTEGTPISVEMYQDRIEIRNPGGLYGYTRIEDLGLVKPETRNPTLANILEILKISENRYSGIPTMIREAQNANLPTPEFINRREEFIVIFRNNSDNKTNGNNPELKDKEIDILEYCSTPRSRKDLMEHFNLTRPQLMKYVNNLVNSKLLIMTIPESPKSKYQKYYAEK